MRTILEQCSNVELFDAPNLMEPDKRNNYLRLMKGYKYGFLVDTDEMVVEADWDLVLEDCKQYDYGILGVNFIVDSKGGLTKHPRIWINPSDWQYYRTHNTFKHKDGTLYNSGQAGNSVRKEAVKGIVCTYNDKLRSERWMKDTVEYQRRMIEYEKPLRL